MFLELLAAFREVRTFVGTPTRATAWRAKLNISDAQRSSPASRSEADRDRGAAELDAVAGSEFVDDRIRVVD